MRTQFSFKAVNSAIGVGSHILFQTAVKVSGLQAKIATSMWAGNKCY